MASSASANTINVVFNPIGSNTAAGLYRYDISLAGSWTIPDSAVSGPAGTTTSSTVGSGDVYDNFTIYDFAGFTSVALNTTPFDFVGTGAIYGARDASLAPPDGAAPNVVFQNLSPGPTVFNAGFLGSVFLTSVNGGIGLGYFTSKDSGGTATGPGPLPTFGSGPTVVPNSNITASTPVPMAASAGLVLFGLIGAKRARGARRQSL
jgi:hypothetical protein